MKTNFFRSLIYVLLLTLIIVGRTPDMASAIDDFNTGSSDTGTDTGDLVSGEDPGSGDDSETGEDPGSGEDSESGEDPGSGDDSGTGEDPGSGEDSESGEDPGSGDDSGTGEDPGSGDDSRRRSSERSRIRRRLWIRR